VSRDYWFGVATIPALLMVLFAAYVFWVRVGIVLSNLGITFKVKTKRRSHEEIVTSYTVRNDIWWERSFGPVFVGGWYRDRSGTRLFNRWVGFGSTTGPCVMFFKKHDLGAVKAPALEVTEDFKKRMGGGV
jgi:hypothetical protein